MPLPRFISPMLAKPGSPFDSDEHIFEIKWDGTRAIGFVEQGSLRLMNRRERDITERYPDLGLLATAIPDGTVLDGEIVVLNGGKPDFNLLQSREQVRTAAKARTAAQTYPATFMAFDLLFDGGASIMRRPLAERRERLQHLVSAIENPAIVLSDGVPGHGTTFFEEACKLELEGVVAKKLSSPYLPGKRGDAWLKIKRKRRMHCAIIGFVPDGERDFRSLILATNEPDGLRAAGKVGSGIGEWERAALNERLWTRLRDTPIVPCSERGKWLEPGLYCTVSYLERTKNGEFRAPVFEELIDES